MNSFIFDFSFLEEGFTARDILEQKINAVSFSDDKDAFYVADLGDIVKKHIRWLKALPRVTPFYAVKCNDSKAIVKTIAILGVGFDCASKAEIQLIQSIGVQPEKIIYANPCKQISDIKYAASCGVEKMTFDSEGELMKVAKNHPNAKPSGSERIYDVNSAVNRTHFPDMSKITKTCFSDSKSMCRLSVKFGATLKTSRLLLQRAKELNIDVIGVSFHVGSGSKDPQTFVQAISDARCVFDMGAELGFNIHLLDIGGGFPGSKNFILKFEEVTSVINSALDKYFPASSGVQIIAEPGRYYVASAFTLAVNIIAKKVMLTEQTGSDDEDDASKKTLMYYVNDGIHGSFNLISMSKTELCIVRKKKSKSDERFYSSSIWGPTCDGRDCIIEQCDLPELQVGDWILFKNMGAYTMVASSGFNGFQRPTLSYVMSRAHWKLMHTIQELGIIPEVPELNDVPVSCVTKNRIKLNSIACAM